MAAYLTELKKVSNGTRRSFTFWEEYGLRMFDKSVLKRTLVPKQEEEIGGWKQLRDGEPNNLYHLPNAIRVIK
jgi:hypothetical protein